MNSFYFKGLRSFLVCFALLIVSTLAGHAQIVSTVGGMGGLFGFSGDNGPAVSALINRPEGLCLDAAGNLYITDNNNQAVRKINTSGIITTLVGNITASYTGDGGPATLATLHSPFEVRVDAAGNIYISDGGNNCIRKINTLGIISTVAGTASPGFSGDGGPATLAQLSAPSGIAFDASGDLLICDAYNQRIRKLTMSTGKISTICGTGTPGYTGDGFSALSATLSFPNFVYVDASGNIYITDNGNHAIRKINTSGIISTVAGIGTVGYTGDGGPATLAQLNFPGGITMDPAGNMFIADNVNNVIRKVDPAGIISTYGGTGVAGFAGDGGIARMARFSNPKDITIDPMGNLFIADFSNSVIRKITFINTPPVFVSGSVQPLSVCQNTTSSSYPISALLKVSDPDLSQTLVWSGVTGGSPSHGILSASYSTLTTGGTVTPSGLSYTPSVGYSGPDAFMVAVSDGVDIDTITINVTVNPLPSAIIAPSVMCQGAVATFSDATAGGTWSSTPPASGAIISSGASAGVFTAGITGSTTSAANIFYELTATGCKVSKVVSLIPAPFITGASLICENSVVSFIESTGAVGAWSATPATVASVTATGAVTAIAAGSASISFTSSASGCSSIRAVSVSPVPVAISGPAVVCQSAIITLSDASAGGSWSSVSAGIAPVVGGVVTGASPGTSIISYTYPSSGCAAVLSVTVEAIPIITGPNTVCRLSSILLNETTGNPGSWTSGTTSVAVVSGGTVTGISAGTTIITYTSTAGGCKGQKTITVNSIPTSIIGAGSVCSGDNLTLTDATPGGTWSSSPVSLITVSSSGIAHAVAAGIPTAINVVVTYTSATNPCFVTHSVVINPQPLIAGAPSVCLGSSVTLSETTGTPGSWSGSGSAASVSPLGVISGITGGTASVSFTATTGGCADVQVFTVNPPPAPISGSPALCAGIGLTFADATAGGVWSVSPSAVASALMLTSSSALITGAASAGSAVQSAVVSYTLPSGCSASYAIVVAPQPVISGHLSVCQSATTTLSELTGISGIWSSGSPSTASVLAGVVTGVSVGATDITFTATTGGCRDSRPMTVNVVPAPITGPGVLCQNDVALLSDADAGGYWSSSNVALASVGTAGNVTGVFFGSLTISYTFPSSGCYSTYPVSVLASPVIAATAGGPVSFCPGGSVSLTGTAGYTSYQWYQNTIAIPGATTTGYTAATTGSFAIAATNTNGCTTVSNDIYVSASASPVISSSSMTSFCHGNTLLLTSNTGGAAGYIHYQWQKNGVDLRGDTSMTYSATESGIYTCEVHIVSSVGTCSGTTPSLLVTVYPLPTPVISAIGDRYEASDRTYVSYQWYVNAVALPGATTWSVVPTFAGSYRVAATDHNGCTGYSSSIYHFNSGIAQVGAADISIYPNPATSTVHIEGPAAMHISIGTISGKTVIDRFDTHDIDVSGLAPGMYLVQVYDENGVRLKTEKLIRE